MLSTDQNSLTSYYTKSSATLSLAGFSCHYTSFSDHKALSEIRSIINNPSLIEASGITDSLRRIDKFMQLAKNSVSKNRSQLYLNNKLYTSDLSAASKVLISELVEKLTPLIPTESFDSIFDFKEIYPDIICVRAQSLLILNFTFMRLAEHYESPSEKFRGASFSREEYKSWYAAQNRENFTYYDDWGGFNIPGNSFISFTEAGFNDLLPIEEFLVKRISQLCKGKTSKFYIIGVDNSEDQTFFEHELAHAFYSLNPEYRSEIEKAVAEIPSEQQLIFNKFLISYGYGEQAFQDETHAYLLHLPYQFKHLGWAKEGLDLHILMPVHEQIANIFSRYRSSS